MTSVRRNWMSVLVGVAQLFAFTIIGLVIAIPLGLAAFVIGLIEVALVAHRRRGATIR